MNCLSIVIVERSTGSVVRVIDVEDPRESIIQALNEVLTEDRVATYPSEEAIRRAKSNEGSA